MGDLGYPASMSTQRPFAEQARQMCPESAEHHAAVWQCQTCWALEQRLTPITMQPAFRALLRDANLVIRNPFARPA